MRYINYLKYVIKHKYYVIKYGVPLGVSLWRLLVHDMSKFGYSEFRNYALTFYSEDGKTQYRPVRGFAYSWNSHQKSNPHHWEYWVLIQGGGRLKPLRMPSMYVKEMVADLLSTGKVKTGKVDIISWFESNVQSMIIHPQTIQDIYDIFDTYNIRELEGT